MPTPMNRRERRAMAAANGGWGPWEPGVLPELSEKQIASIKASGGDSTDIDSLVKDQIIMMNLVYQVNIRKQRAPNPAWPDIIHLSIKRRDRKPVGIERFRDFQRIKNELVNPEAEAAELYPMESRLVDTSNQYHLWVLAEPGRKFPFGYTDRLVMDEEAAKSVGAVQQPLKLT